MRGREKREKSLQSFFIRAHALLCFLLLTQTLRYCARTTGVILVSYLENWRLEIRPIIHLNVVNSLDDYDTAAPVHAVRISYQIQKITQVTHDKVRYSYCTSTTTVSCCTSSSNSVKPRRPEPTTSAFCFFFFDPGFGYLLDSQNDCAIIPFSFFLVLPKRSRPMRGIDGRD
ncbi:hypothetical protein HOY82DRAFT_196990 [Tuber indicum]|nr:hypothetical protein HOY82DRAFT_196990 [Tuber indicum]